MAERAPADSPCSVGVNEFHQSSHLHPTNRSQKQLLVGLQTTSDVITPLRGSQYAVLHKVEVTVTLEYSHP